MKLSTPWLLLTALACSERGTPIHPAAGAAGAAGASTDVNAAGSAGAPVGSPSDAGAAGTGSVEPDAGDDAGAAPFQAFLDGPAVRLRALRDVWLSTCAGSIQVGRRQDGVWAPLRDDRPDADNQQHDAHYLDGAFHSACRLTLGCDVSSCVSLPSGSQLEDWEYEVDNWPMLAREYIQVGEIAVPECGTLDGGINPPGSDAGTRQVPQIETRAPSGTLELMVRYRLDDRCQVAGGTAYVPIE